MCNSTVSQSIAVLYSDHHGWLNGWLRRKLGCTHRAADLAHDTFLRLLVSGRLPEPEFSRAYLTRIAKGMMVDQFRRRQIEQAWLDTLAQIPEEHAPSPENRTLIIETLIAIDAALNRLPQLVRETFLLSQFDGLTYATIAERLGIAQATVRKYMLKASMACYAALEDSPPASD